MVVKCPIRNMWPCQEGDCAFFDKGGSRCYLGPADSHCETVSADAPDKATMYRSSVRIADSMGEISESLKTLNLKIDALYKAIAKRA